MLPNLGFGELLLILLVALLLFGAKRLPELARSLGNSVNAFKEGMKGVADDAAPVKKDAKEEVKEKV